MTLSDSRLIPKAAESTIVFAFSTFVYFFLPKEKCLRQPSRQYCIVMHKSYYSHAEQVSSPFPGKVQDFPELKM